MHQTRWLQLEELRDFVLSKYNKESNCLVILNTKKTAEALYESINSYLKNNHLKI